MHPSNSPLLSDMDSSSPPIGWSEQLAVQLPNPSGGEMPGSATLSSVRSDTGPAHLPVLPLGAIGPFLPLLLLGAAWLLRRRWLWWRRQCRVRGRRWI